MKFYENEYYPCVSGEDYLVPEGFCFEEEGSDLTIGYNHFNFVAYLNNTASCKSIDYMVDSLTRQAREYKESIEAFRKEKEKDEFTLLSKTMKELANFCKATRFHGALYFQDDVICISSENETMVTGITLPCDLPGCIPNSHNVLENSYNVLQYIIDSEGYTKPIAWS